MKKIILTIAVFAICRMPAAIYAADEEQDWYTWYEQQNTAAAQQAENEYAQYYEATSPDQNQANYGDVAQNPYPEATPGDAVQQPGDGAPQSGEGEAGWVWAETPPDQTQQDASQQQDAPSPEDAPPPEDAPSQEDAPPAEDAPSQEEEPHD
jgi:hypothetical protein